MIWEFPVVDSHLVLMNPCENSHPHFSLLTFTLNHYLTDDLNRSMHASTHKLSDQRIFCVVYLTYFTLPLHSTFIEKYNLSAVAANSTVLVGNNSICTTDSIQTLQIAD